MNDLTLWEAVTCHLSHLAVSSLTNSEDTAKCDKASITKKGSIEYIVNGQIVAGLLGKREG